VRRTRNWTPAPQHARVGCLILRAVLGFLASGSAATEDGGLHDLDSVIELADYELCEVTDSYKSLSATLSPVTDFTAVVQVTDRGPDDGSLVE
jgi:hypothetical protein